jgi:hypothetical protein
MVTSADDNNIPVSGWTVLVSGMGVENCMELLLFNLTIHYTRKISLLLGKNLRNSPVALVPIKA